MNTPTLKPITHTHVSPTAAKLPSNVAPSSIKPNLANQLHAKTTATTRYILEGGIIKVYVTNEAGEMKCVKLIPLEAASMEILCQVECSNFMDAMLLQEAKQNKAGQSDAQNQGYDKTGQCQDQEL